MAEGPCISFLVAYTAIGERFQDIVDMSRFMLPGQDTKFRERMSNFTNSVIEAMWMGTLCSVLVGVIWSMNPALGWLFGLLFFISGLIAAYKIWDRNKVFSSMFGFITTIFAVIVALGSIETLKNMLIAAVVVDAISPLMPKLPGWLAKKWR